ncbi:hypothetical protein ACUTJJ_25055, partial [Agrobacterium sp. DKPNP3]|uniref:hypothetical protein n=1 Tax=Agrobacterium sp. DKPNP3 TaxID=3457323 RepID=UPI004044077A
SRPRKLRRPRFSFFSYSIVKKQTTQRSHKIKSPKPNGLETKQATSSFLDFLRTKDFVASSAAALVQ